MTIDISQLKMLQVEHRNWKSAFSNAFALLSYSDPGDVICITGPSQAGKSRLIKELISHLVSPEDAASEDIIRAVSVEAVNSSRNGVFSTKAFTLRLLRAVKHPIFGDENTLLNPLIEQSRIDRTTEDTFRFALEDAFIARKTRYLFIDEAQHVRYVSKDALGGAAVFDSWKCLAADANIVLVIVGAYPILGILQRTPHVVGRKRQIDLCRYLLDKDDIGEFMHILSHYDLIVAGEGHQLLTDHAELLFEGSLGCIGLLRRWIVHACAIANTENETLGIKYLLETKPAETDLDTIRFEIEQGEKYLADTQASPRSSVSKKKSTGKPFQAKPRTFKPGHRS